MRYGVLPALAAPTLAGCLLGVTFVDVGPRLVADPSLIAPAAPHPVDGLFRARAGDELIVELRVDRTLDPVRSWVRLGGTRLEPQNPTSTDVYRFRTVLTGDEGSAPMVLGGTLVDEAGTESVLPGDLVVTFDFLPPEARCELRPSVAGLDQDVTLTITASEPIDPDDITVTDSSGAVTITSNAHDDTTHRYTVSSRSRGVHPYTLDVSATDRAGNGSKGPLCDIADRTGVLVNELPALEGVPTLTAWPAVDVAGTLHVRAGAVVSVTVPTVRPIDPTRSSVRLGDIALTWVEGDTWQHSLDGTESEGLKALALSLVDDAGNTQAISGLPAPPPLAVDFTAPGIVGSVLNRSPFLLSAVSVPGEVGFSDVDPRTGERTSARLTLVATEVLGTEPSLTPSPGAVAWASLGTDGREAAWFLDDMANVPEGRHISTVVLTDRVGNRSAPLVLEDTLVMDRTPPDPPDVDSPNRVTWTRAPWGDATYNGQARFEAEGMPGAVVRGAKVLLLSVDAAPLAETDADEFGAFGPVSAAFDATTVRLAQLDSAGNRSQAVRVRDVRWIATLRGDAATGDDPNPHSVEAFATAPTVRGAENGTVVQGPDPGAARGVDTSGAGHWEEVGAPPNRPEEATVAGAAWNPVSGTRLVVTDDGVSRDLTTWVGRGSQWLRLEPAGDRPSRRSSTHLAFDPGRQQVILFGGYLDQELGDLWAWDGDRWQALAPQGSRPAPRDDACFVTDEARREVVLSGGSGQSGYLDDTWVWDGVGWTLRAASGGPGFRLGNACGWDASGDQIVLVGGIDPNFSSWAAGFQWSWRGAGWLKETALGARPPDRFAAAVNPDGAGGLLLHGGLDEAFTPLWDTWRWADGAWTEVGAPMDAETARSDALLIGPTVGEGPLLLGGFEAGTPARTQWSWSGEAWHFVPTRSEEPRARSGGVLATQPDDSGVMLFGGFGGGLLRDTWTWDGAHWARRLPDVSPPSRVSAAAVLAPMLDAVVVMGGQGPGGLLSDVWRWDGREWSQGTAAPPSLAARRGAHLALDPVDGAPVAFGGDTREVRPWPSDTWRLDDEDWVILDVQGSVPPGRDSATFVTHTAGASAVLVGGNQNANLGPATWLWDGADWTLGPDAPDSITAAAAAYDPDRREVVLFGGWNEVDFLASTWIWDGAAWTSLTNPGGNPPGRTDHAMAWDPVAHRVLLFGGDTVRDDSTNEPTTRDTWAWSGGASERPGHVVHIDLSRLDAASRAGTTGVSLRVRAGGEGFPADVLMPGVELAVWEGLRWQPLATSNAAAGSPGAVCAGLNQSGEPVPLDPGCTNAPYSVTELGPYLGGPVQPALHLAITPRAPNGPTVPGGRYGRVRTEDVEVTLHIRLDADDVL